MLFIITLMLTSSIIALQNNYYQLFQQWKEKHNIHFNTPYQSQYRYQVWLQTFMFIQQHNLDKPHVKLNLNKFSHLTDEEFNLIYAQGYRKQSSSDQFQSHKSPNSDFVKPFIDWRQLNAVTSVKDQGGCGSCWAFSTVGALEATYAINQLELIDFSPQQLVDCCRIQNYGCTGGDPVPAMQCIIRDGIMREEDYPYVARFTKSCFLDKSKTIYKPNSYESITPQVPSEIKKALNIQPIAACMNSDAPIFKSYSAGIIQEGDCSDVITHCVLLVGYDSENGQDYWIVKNSWGAQWGEEGYMRLQRTDNKAGPGTCGIQKEPTLSKWN